jgi:ankyrin repeat protein
LYGSGGSQAGEIVCILDALDECDSVGRNILIDSLVGYYSSRRNPRSKLKFLVTSRPYYDIDRRFRAGPIGAAPMIRLAGEDETMALQKEIDMVVQARVSDLALQMNLSRSAEATLKQKLQGTSNRTYLWLILILDQIEIQIPEPGARGMERLIEQLPVTVSEAYEAILSKVTDREVAFKMLQIIALAKRPLSLQEMNVALHLEANAKSYEGLDLDDIESFAHRIRNSCGLFVSIIDSKVYLFHPTAREFLLSDDNFASSDWKWKHSINPIKSHLVLANICTSYLLFDYFETTPLEIAVEDSRDLIQTNVDRYTANHALLSYAAENWADHFREARDTVDQNLLKLGVELCSTKSGRFLTWFRVYWIGLGINAPLPQKFTDLMVASYFGLHTVVHVLLDREVKIDAQDSSGWTALHHSSYRGHDRVVVQLLSYGASTRVEDSSGSTTLHRAAESGHDDIMLLLLEHAADIEAKDENGDTALHVAIYKGHDSVVKVILDQRPHFLSSGGWGKTLVLLATNLGENESTEIVKERYNSIVSLLKDAVFASLGLTQGPLLPVDRKFKASIVYFPKDPQKIVLRQMKQVPLNELIDGQVDLKIEKDSLMFKWFHVPANNVFHPSKIQSHANRDRCDGLRYVIEHIYLPPERFLRCVLCSV